MASAVTPYPVEAVGILLGSHTPEDVRIGLGEVMRVACEQCQRRGETDPAVIRQAMQAARDAFLAAH